ncbi:MAG: hypothetical protein R6V75_06070 [Bacteroidales bacterium]
MKREFLIPTLLLLIGLAGCEIEPLVPPSDEGYRHGIFVINEGAMGNSNGSVSHFNPDSSRVTNYLFDQANGRPLGDVVQSLTIVGRRGFIVVNNSQKVEVVDMAGFESVGSIEGLDYPRFLFALDSTKGYLSDGNFEGRVHVVDLLGLQIVSSIPCGKGPERMVLHGHHLLVVNSGGFDNDSTITVIDTRTDQVAATWATGYNPVDMVMDQHDRLWVLCKGKTRWNPDWTLGIETSSEIKIHDPASGTILETIVIGQIGDYYWPSQMARNPAGNRIYLIEAEGILEIDLDVATHQPSLLISGSYYGFGVHPNDGQIITLICPSFTTSGSMVRHTPAGDVVDSFEVGIGPNRVVFN